MTNAHDPEDRLRKQVRAALLLSDITQAYAARQLGLSPQHLNQMLTGKATLSLGWAEQILSLCGMRLTLGIEVVAP
jgi:DNA-binding transcriptional regulator YdaS (Cro superfamily)